MSHPWLRFGADLLGPIKKTQLPRPPAHREIFVEVVDDKTRYADWDNRGDIKAELKVDLIMLLAKIIIRNSKKAKLKRSDAYSGPFRSLIPV